MCSVFDPKKIKKTQRMCVCVCVRPHLHSADEIGTAKQFETNYLLQATNTAGKQGFYFRLLFTPCYKINIYKFDHHPS